jgi:D-alanyl-lipoteichoic acid acyltransferase DltB (MBOAT superfamily)
MLFNSFEFIIFFLPVTLAVYFFLSKKRLTVAANAWLLAASLFFYSWWNIKYLPLILGSILFNYTIGSLLIDNDTLKKKSLSTKAIFVAGIVVNVSFLCYFKYMDFFINNINSAFKVDIPLMHIVLPIGISFFTITQIAYLVDCYEGLVEERKLLNYAMFVTFFPHLLAGPILHHQDMMPQFDITRNKVINYKNLTLGLYLFLIGLFKKQVIADTLAPLADAGFGNSQALTLLEAWVASLSYTLQLYFDFSGYSDMAIGVGLMFNIILPVNFNSPYKAKNIIDFWKRWHITLTNFITTYIYTPLLKSFGTVNFRNSLVSIFIAMLIAGLWHGAGWTFIIWGGLHGAALVVNHLWKKRKLVMKPAFAWLLTFSFVNVAFVFFRAKNIQVAINVLSGMVGLHGYILPPGLERRLACLANHGALFGRPFININGKGDVAIMFAMLPVVFMARNSTTLAGKRDFSLSRANLCRIVLLILVNLIYLNSIQSKEFLYFDF